MKNIILMVGTGSVDEACLYILFFFIVEILITDDWGLNIY